MAATAVEHITSLRFGRLHVCPNDPHLNLPLPCHLLSLGHEHGATGDWRARQRSAAQIRFDVAPTPPTARALEGGVGAKRARPAEEDPEAAQASSGQASASHGGPVAIAPRGAMWHFLNRQSAAALPPRERGV